jgi:glycosyltransferase involved in cell wall biosynthesis
VQFTNPAGYPPLEHSAAILAESGCQVLMLGLDTLGTFLVPRAHAGIQVRLLKWQPPGWRQKVHYFVFVLWASLWVLRWRPSWIYASDALSTPVALILRRIGRLGVIYHEHDIPDEARADARPSAFMRVVLGARRRLARAADLCVIPNEARARAFAQETGASSVIVVCNCPRRDDASSQRSDRGDQSFRILYHGSVGPAHVPLAVIDALASLGPSAELVIAGYPTASHPEYVGRLLARARELGIADRLDYVGGLPLAALRDLRATCDVGLALLPKAGLNPNEAAMTGASNKPFQYLASRLPILVSDLPDWRAMFVEPGFARACDPESPASIAAEVTWFIEHPHERRTMGEQGRVRVATEWNYEHEFEPVRKILAGVVPRQAAAARRGHESAANAAFHS